VARLVGAGLAGVVMVAVGWGKEAVVMVVVVAMSGVDFVVAGLEAELED